MSAFAFVPRQISRPGKSRTQRNLQRTGAARATSNASLPSFSTPNGTQGHVPVATTIAMANEEEKYMDDHVYASLLSLSLSDHTLWSNMKLRRAIEEADDGFISIRTLIRRSTAFAHLNPIPPDTVLVRAVRSHASEELEARMILAEPDDGWSKEGGDHGSEYGTGGYQIRRKGWKDVLERVRKQTTSYWEARTVYAESLPLHSRFPSTISAFLGDVLSPVSQETNRMGWLQNIVFPPHRDDTTDSQSFPKCKGFAFLLFSEQETSGLLTQLCPWDEIDVGSRDHLVGNVAAEAVSAGFRTISKRRWDKLRDEYLGYQKDLLTLTLDSDDIKEGGESDVTLPSSNGYHKQHLTTRSRPPIFPLPPPPPPGAIRSNKSYPEGCLVFVKNVHTETNKTTLKSLFKRAFEGNSDGGIDYVDYTKGMDSCHLRLMSPADAHAIISFFTAHPFAQKDGMDTGTLTPESHDSAIEMQLVQGSREEIYWEKVPDRVKRESMAKVQQTSSNADPPHIASPELPKMSQSEYRTLSYPLDCLVFVKNIHPDTNKTTLRALVKRAFDSDVEAIDYVDFVKGIDTCHVRLVSPSSARALVSYLSSRELVQTHGLDDAGTPCIEPGRHLIAELVQGTKEKIYWEKIPEKLKAQALAKVQANLLKPAANNIVPSVETRREKSNSQKKRKRF